MLCFAQLPLVVVSGAFPLRLISSTAVLLMQVLHDRAGCSGAYKCRMTQLSLLRLTRKQIPGLFCLFEGGIGFENYQNWRGS